MMEYINKQGGNTMRKPIIGLMLLIFAAMIMLTGCGKAPKDVVAKVGKYTITAEELDENVAMLKGRWKSPTEAYDGKLAALDKMIERKLMLLEAYSRGLDKDTLVVKSLEQGEQRRKLIGLWEMEIVEKTQVTDAELKERYDKMGSEYNAAHILVKDSVFAEDIYGRIVKGEDFGELAQKHSEDPGSGAKGGDLGWFSAGRMVKEFEEGVFALQDGEVSKPLKTRFGWHIIKRIAMRPRADRRPFEEEKDMLRQMVEREKQTTRMEEYLEGLYTTYEFSFDENAIAKVADRYKNPEDPVIMSMDDKDLMLAKWKGGEFKVGQLDSLYLSQPPYRRPSLGGAEQLQDFVKQACQEKLLMAETDRVNITQHPKYKEAYEKELEEAMLRQIQQDIYTEINLTDDDLRKYYDANLDSFVEPRTIIVKEVQVKTEAEGQRILSDIKAGADITKIAENKSERKHLQSRNWELEITEARLPELYAAVAKATSGEVVGPVLDNRASLWSVMKVVTIREAAPMDFERVKGRIKSQLGREVRDNAMVNFMEKARSNHSVKIFEENVAASVDSAAYAEPIPVAIP
jgi:foldase protein PrsA